MVLMSKMIKMQMIKALKNSLTNKNKPKRKRENSDHSHIALITVSGKRKIDLKKVTRSSLLQAVILILKRLSEKEAGFIILIHQVHSLI